MKNPILVLVTTIVLILTVSVLLIFQAKGYKFDFKNRKIDKTGIIALSSTPTGAAVYLNGTLTSATNTTLSDLAPGEYRLKLDKEGYLPWEKKVVVEAGLVTPVDVTLFPAAPELRPLTFSGVSNPLLSPDGVKVVYALKSGEKSGLWVMDLADRPFSFSREQKQIVRDTRTLSFSASQYSWAPDSKAVLSILKESSYLLGIDQINNDRLLEVTSTISETQKTWDEDKNLKNQERLSRLTTSLGKEIASASAQIQWSPDETRFISSKKLNPLRQLTDDGVNSKVSVYDIRKDKSFDLPEAKRYIWYPDSRHIILVEEKSIEVVEHTGGNKTVIYNGNFDEKVVFPWPNGSKLVIAVNFNPSIKEPNLYTINLR